MKEARDSGGSIELTQAMTLILIVLSQGARHGYAIMTEIVSMSSGAYRVSAGTLYRSISQMLKHGLVEEAPELFNPELDDERRKYYRITAQGQRLVVAELHRIEKLIQGARAQGVFGHLAGGNT